MKHLRTNWSNLVQQTFQIHVLRTKFIYFCISFAISGYLDASLNDIAAAAAAAAAAAVAAADDDDDDDDHDHDRLLMIDVSSTRSEPGAVALEFAWFVPGLAQVPRLSGSW